MAAEYRGARWWRCDLHVHTPFDRRHFGENLRDIEVALETGNRAPLEAMAARFWAACERVDVVGITDHNTIQGYRLLVPFLRTLSEHAIADGRHAPVFLPGVELTVGSERPMHFLALFSTECDPDDIEQVIRGAFGANPTHSDRGEPLPSGRPIGDFLTDLKSYCSPDSGDRKIPFIVIPAHVESSTGVAVETGTRDNTGPDLLQQMRGVLRERAITRASWHGFQTTHEFSRLPQGLRDLLCVWEANRRDQRWDDLNAEERTSIRSLEHWPLIEASDPQTLDDIGSRYSWLKMAVPDLEGIRLALLDPESRLRRMAVGEPGRQHPQIRSISIDRTDFIESVEVALSANLTTIIGGRGSGKSTLVEMLRYGLLRDQPADFDREEEETRRNLERLLRVKAQRDWGRTAGVLLADSHVEIRFAVGGIEYVARRTPEVFSVTREGGTGEAGLPEGVALDIRSLIKPQILSQGQISRIARDPAAQRREMDRVAADEPGVSEFARQRSLLVTRMESVQSELRVAREDESQMGPTLTELQTVRDQLEVLESGPTRETLQRFALLQRESRLLGNWRQAVDGARSSLQETAREIRESAQSIAGDNELGDFVVQEAQRTRLALEQGATAVEAAAGDLGSFAEGSDERRAAAWEPDERRVGLEYSTLIEELRTPGISAEQHAGLVAHRSRLEQQLADLRLSADRAPSLSEQFDRLWRELDQIHATRYAARTAVGEMLTEQDADIRLTVIRYGDRESLDSRREGWFAGTNLHANDWDTMVDWVFGEDADIQIRWRRLVEALIADRQDANGAATSEGRGLRDVLGERTAHLSGHIWRAIPRMNLARLEEMFRSLPEDRVEAAVRDPEGDFKPIEQGSLGQRSTAIVSLIMSAGDQPLVIDQPEEDLDNQYVYRAVVGLLRKRKFSRQLILATHNANIPVNGDAELIIAMKVGEKLGVVGSEGAIDHPTVKADVNAILEGSAEAFRLRRRRYGY